MPDFIVTSPEGKKFKVTAPDGASQDQVLAYAKENFEKQAATKPPGDVKPFVDRMGTGERLARGFAAGASSVGRGAQQAVVDSTSKLPVERPSVQEMRAYAAPEDRNLSDDQLRQKFEQASKTGVSEALRQREDSIRQQNAPLMATAAGRVGNFAGQAAAVAPAMLLPGANTLAGATALGGMTGALAPVGTNDSRFGNAVTGAAGGALGAGVGKAIGAGANAITSRAAARQVANTESDAAIQAAKDAGYKLPPSQAGGTGGKLLEAASGKVKTEQSLSRANQTVTNTLAKRALGLSEDKPITDAAVRAVRNKANAAYNAVASLGKVKADNQYIGDISNVGSRTADMVKDFPEAASEAVEKLKDAYFKQEFTGKGAVQAVRVLRADATKNLKAPNDPEKNALGHAQREVAEALDGMLERHAQANGTPDLVARYREARQLLAKTHAIEGALNTSSGNVSARSLAKALDRGAPLSGELRTIARAHAAFPKATQDVEKLGGHGPFDAVDYLAGVLGATHNPLGAAAIVARPVARAAIRSAPYQRAFIGPGSYGTPVSNSLSTLFNNEAAKRAAGPLGALTLQDLQDPQH